MKDTFDLDRRDRRALDRREQNPAQCTADRRTVTPLERLRVKTTELVEVRVSARLQAASVSEIPSTTIRSSRRGLSIPRCGSTTSSRARRSTAPDRHRDLFARLGSCLTVPWNASAHPSSSQARHATTGGRVETDLDRCSFLRLDSRKRHHEPALTSADGMSTLRPSTWK